MWGACQKSQTEFFPFDLWLWKDLKITMQTKRWRLKDICEQLQILAGQKKNMACKIDQSQHAWLLLTMYNNIIGFLYLSGSTCKQTTCSSPWKLALHNDANGNVLSGSKYSLMAAVLSGARVRVIIGTSYSTEADNVHVFGNHVFAQLLQHVSKASWDRFQDNAYWWLWWYVVNVFPMT